MVEGSAVSGRSLDWDLIADYLEIFQLEEKLNVLKNWYGSIDRNR